MKTFKILFATFVLGLTGCSYVMDSVEAKLTKRASFSATAEASGSNLVFGWETSNSDNFAGYEIYVTSQPDNEYADYRLLSCTYDLDTSWNVYVLSALENIDSSSLILSGAVAEFAGHVYFFRVAHVCWSLSSEEKRLKEWTRSKGYLYDWPPSNSAERKYFYQNCTNIDEVSGSVMLEL